jgi:hypothetical protein
MITTINNCTLPLLVGAALSLLTAGCATDLSISTKDSISSLVKISTGEKILVLKFVDQRTKPELGRAGSAGPRVLLKDDVGSWIGQAVFFELQQGGFPVEKARELHDAYSGVVITGKILEAEARTGPFSVDGTIRTFIMVKRGDKVLLGKEYSAKGHVYNNIGAPIFPGYEESVRCCFQGAIEKALQNMIKGVRPDLVNAIGPQNTGGR